MAFGLCAPLDHCVLDSMLLLQYYGLSCMYVCMYVCIYVSVCHGIVIYNAGGGFACCATQWRYSRTGGTCC